jgi:hypothetical protein
MTEIRNVCTKNVAQYSCIFAVLLSTMNDKDKKCVCTKNVAQYSCIIAVLLSITNEKNEKNMHQCWGFIDFTVLLLYY